MNKFILVTPLGNFMKATKLTREDGTSFISNTFCSNVDKAKRFDKDEAIKEAERLVEANYEVEIKTENEVVNESLIFSW